MERETEGWASPVWCPFPVLNTKTSGQALGRYVVKESSHPGIHSSAISKTHLLFPHPTHLSHQPKKNRSPNPTQEWSLALLAAAAASPWNPRWSE